jgi:hypothetical protein
MQRVPQTELVAKSKRAASMLTRQVASQRLYINYYFSKYNILQNPNSVTANQSEIVTNRRVDFSVFVQAID